jgi:hypothetical protein
MKIALTVLVVLAVSGMDGVCQKGPTRYFDDPILTDSLSTLFIPTRYNAEFLSTNKIANGNDYLANIIVYNYQTDVYKKLFEKDTFIERIMDRDFGNGFFSNLTAKWVFLLVKSTDSNNSGRIDEKDPTILFAVSVDGTGLRQLTDENESVARFLNFSGQNFLLLKIQRDSDNDKSFKNDEKEFYFRKLNLSDLTLGKKIELK